MPSNFPSPQRMVEVGILPENLPSSFSTRSLWKHFVSLGSAYAVTSQVLGEYAIYNASKRGGQRRLFQIPHPAYIRDQAIFLEKHWSDIESLFQKSTGSASRPQFSINKHRHVQFTSHSELPQLRLKAFSRYKYCLVTDVSRFFPSVYTHSIPWALNGKKAAKSDIHVNSATVFGNRLDFILMQAQSKQTIGIPVGPNSSKVVSEIIMSAVDADFIEKSGKNKPTFIRHVDDYWIAGDSYEHCEKHLQNLRSSLRGFELDINENKTKIVSTRSVISDDWPYEFDAELVASIGVNPGAKALMISVLGKIVNRATADGDDGIVRHAIRKIDESRQWSKQWELLEHFLAQCTVQFPHSFDYVARVIAWRKRRSEPVDKDLWKEVSTQTIRQNATLGRDSEVVWAMWLLKELGETLPKSATDEILLNSNAIPLSFLAHFSARKLTSDRKLKDKLASLVSGDPLSGVHWPLTLEMSHLGIAPKQWLTNPSSPLLATLHKASASIIDWHAKPAVFEKEDGDDDDNAADFPDFAIEDFVSEYGSDNASELEQEFDDIEDSPF